MPEACSRCRAPPPAPTKTNFARIEPCSPDLGCLIDRSQPPPGARLMPGDVVAVVDLHAVVAEVGGQLAGQGAEVDVGPFRGAGGGDALLRVAALDDQRGPLGDLGVVLGVFHRAEQRVRLERLVAGAQELGVVLADHEAHVRHGVDEALGGADHAVRDQVGPELAGQLELLVDEERLGGVHRAVFGGGGVVELTQRRVSGAGVVPGAGALQTRLVQLLEQGDRPVRLELLQEGTERGAHDAAANQDDVGMLGLGNESHNQSPISSGSGCHRISRTGLLLKLAPSVKALAPPL